MQECANTTLPWFSDINFASHSAQVAKYFSMTESGYCHLWARDNSVLCVSGLSHGHLLGGVLKKKYQKDIDTYTYIHTRYLFPDLHGRGLGKEYRVVIGSHDHRVQSFAVSQLINQCDTLLVRQTQQWLRCSPHLTPTVHFPHRRNTCGHT